MIRTRTTFRRFSPLALSVLAGACFLMLAASPLPGQAKVKAKDLAPQFQEWLKLTTYIITDKELDVFLHLQNDRDRDIFIQAFWNMRDPTPATPQNEFKEEHLKRFKEADYRFHFGSSRAGRIYIILGPPVSKTSIAGSLEVYPAEIWAYYGDTGKGIPTYFELCFFQYRNAGEYKLYSPVADGPAKLLVNSSNYPITDYQALYEKLQNEQPELARVSLSIVPGDMPYGYQPTLDSISYMAAILDSPKKGFDDRYATHFLNYRGVVSTEYLTNYMKSEGAVAILFDAETGLAFCDFAIAPERLSLDYYEPKSEFSCNFIVDVNLRAGENVVLQYSKDYPLTIPEARIKETESMGICIADSFPVVEGKTRLTVLLRNTIGKEFSILERDIEVPPAAGPPRLLAPVFGAKTENSPAGARLPFQAGGRKLQVDPKSTFVHADQISFMFSVSGLTRELWEDGSVGIAVKGTSPAAPFEKNLTLPLKGQPFGRSLVISQSIGAADFPPDYYEMTLLLKDGPGKVLDEKKCQFIISPVNTLAHPLIASKAFSRTNVFMYHYMLAYQYSQTGQFDRAGEAYRRALAINPAYLLKVPEYAGFLLKVKKPEEARQIIEMVKDDANLKFQYFLIKGRALAGLGRYDEAILSLQEGNKIYNSDSGLLAVLGTCYYKTGEKQRALTALKASLSLNQDQPEVKALIQEIEGKK
jgi:GWxTD domain-containing protein